MTLIEDWNNVITKLWSFRLAILSATLSGAEVAVQVYQPVFVGSGVFAAIAGLISLAAAVARAVAQPKAFDADASAAK